ncbi:hypothetical protein [uncultured Dokdonia sp.]|uniref:hypothetical protein n=1 Tax=uncultured Dokdonia sp. TaxID=575653 RepID=UPI00262E86D7|nr:hypothetical protein [uncultured Dokdonia sp.]
MKTTLIVLGAAALLCFVSCKNTEEVTKDNIEEKATEETFDSTGYTSGVIEYSQEKEDCEYTIKLKDGLYYDPINLEDGYKKDGMTVYFKFSPLRMKNRCNKANPVSIKEMLPAKK